MKRKPMRLTLVSVMASVLLVMWQRGEHRDDVGSTPANPGSGALDSIRKFLGGQRSHLLWPSGQESRFELELDLDLELGNNAGARAANAPFAIQVRGQAVVTALQQDGQGTLLKLSLEPRTVALPNADPNLQVQLQQQLTGPAFFRLNARGQAEEVRLPARVPAFAGNVQRALIAALQYSRPESEAERWTVVELDATGRAEVRYQRVSELQVRKQKLRYESVLAQQVDNSASNTTIEQSEGTFWLAPDGALSRLAVSEQIAVQGHDVLGARSTLRFSLKAIGARPVADVTALLAEAQSYQATPLHGGSQGFSREEKDQAWIAGLDLPGAMDRLSQLPVDKDGDRASRDRIYLAVTSLLRQDESARREAVARIASGHPEAKLLLSALGDSGTPAAKRELVELLGSGRLDNGLRLHAARSLVAEGPPTQVVIEKLRELKNDPQIGLQAHYGLGSAAQAAAEAGNAELASELNRELLADVRASKNQAELVRGLRALGNAGHPDSTSELAAQLDSESPAVRRAAAAALRFVPGARADELLASVLQKDAEPQVRYEAAVSIGFRKPTMTLLEALKSAALRDAIGKVRLTAAEVLTGRAWPKDQVSPIMQALTERGDRELREMAQRWLALRS
jgi:hypothetical protein